MMDQKHLDSLKKMLTPQEPQTRYLVQSIELEETQPPQLYTSLIYTICGLIVGTVLWAGITEVTEMAQAEGKVVPKSDIQAIQHLEGGIVSAIHVREGQIVKEGEALVNLAPTDTRAQLEQLRARRAAALLEMERFRAVADERNPDFDAQIEGYQNLKMDQLAIFSNQRDAFQGQREVLTSQLEQQRIEEKRLTNKVATLEHEAALLKDELKTQQELFDKGLSVRQNFLAIQREEGNVRGSLEEAHERLNGVRSSINEAQNKVSELISSTKTDALSRVGELSTQIAELDERLKSVDDRANRLAITAPVDGIVQQLGVKAINAVVQPGQTLLEIVPIDDELMVEARIDPSDIGHVRLGQDVDLKFSTYDFAIYGSVPGILERVSASTFQTPEGIYYYQAMVKPLRLFVGNDAAQNPILPGMVVQASVNVGEKSILDYLLKPIYRGFSQAFREK